MIGRCTSFALVSLVTALALFRSAAAAEGEDPAKADPQFAQLEKTLSKATLVGHFTVTGKEGERLTDERYELGEVRHLGDNQWLIQARIRYGEHDVTLPLTLPIRWAGDTPMICVDEVAFPGLGTYTARVMIYRNHYAGFWTGGDHGGHLFGVIERADK